MAVADAAQVREALQAGLRTARVVLLGEAAVRLPSQLPVRHVALK